MKIRFVIISNLILILASQITWLVLNPYLWEDPLFRTIKMFQQRANEMSAQMEAYPLDRIEGFYSHIEVPIRRIFSSYASINENGSWYMNLFFFINGLIYIIIESIKYLKHLSNNPASTALLIVGLTASLPSFLPRLIGVDIS